MNEYMKNLVDEIQKEFPQVTLEQVFSGHIEDVLADKIYVHLHDETHGDEDLVAEMDVETFPKDPLYPKFEPGNIFYWYIGFEGQDEKPFSLIRMNQETWTQERLDKMKEEAEKLYLKLSQKTD